MIDLTGDDELPAPKRPRTQEPARAVGIHARDSNEDGGIEIVRRPEPARNAARDAELQQGDEFKVLEDATKVGSSRTTAFALVNLILMGCHRLPSIARAHR